MASARKLGALLVGVALLSAGFVAGRGFHLPNLNSTPGSQFQIRIK